ncbi:STAS-like domain-containing protein [Hymenobacter aerophilus]|uniref:STAS-like domain-containing protein n=1 Tax=Hymenobacter aerophilus TaxID=119644 RepID=UPI000379D356|nr:DUF4325 domain-containing protein [Hymenobacter aerophilus]
MTNTKIVVRDLIGKANAILDKDGRLLAEQLEAAWLQHRQVEVSFADINLITSAFLNAAWGRFLLHVPEGAERQARAQYVTFSNLAPDAHRTAIVENMLDQIRRKALDAAYCAQYDNALTEAVYA